jgi:hypothetical protein
MNSRIYTSSRRGFLKGLAVGAGGYALSSLVIRPNEAMGQSIEGYLEKVSMETRWKIASSTGVAAAVRSWKARYDKEGREKIVESARERSPVTGAQLKGLADSFGFTGNDAKSMAAIMPALITLWAGPTQKYEIEGATAEKAILKCVNCAYWNAAQAQKITDDLCSAGSQYMAEGLAKALNPKMTSTLVKAKPRGDSVCEWLIELKA